MASLLLGCGAVFSSSLRRKQQLKKERQRERRENFETLKAENEKRVQRISGSIDGGLSGDQTGLPKYDDIIAGEDQRQDAIRRSSTHLASAGTERRTSKVRDFAQPEARDAERRIAANCGNGRTSVENAAAP